MRNGWAMHKPIKDFSVFLEKITRILSLVRTQIIVMIMINYDQRES